MKINKVCEYKGLKIGKPTTEQATEDELNEAINSILAQNEEEIEKDTEAVAGDIANIDFEGFLDGVPFEGGKGEHYDLALGSGTFIPGFEEQLIGHKKGEDVDVNVTFPENYQAANLAGKAVVFKYKIHAVKEKKTPELNDDFAKKFQLNNVEEVKQVLREQIFIQKTNKDLNGYLTKVWDKLCEDSDIELVDADLTEKIDQMVKYYESSMAQYGMTLDQFLEMSGKTKEAFQEEIKPEAVKTKKIDVLFTHIVTQEGFNVTDEDIEKELTSMKTYYGLQDADIERIKKENIEDIKKEILKTKVSTFLLKNND